MLAANSRTSRGQLFKNREQLADHIIVLKNGRVEAAGDLETLLASRAETQRLWRSDQYCVGEVVIENGLAHRANLSDV